MTLSRLMVATLLCASAVADAPGLGLVGSRGGRGARPRGPPVPACRPRAGTGKPGRPGRRGRRGDAIRLPWRSRRARGDTEPQVPHSSRCPGRHKSEITGDIVSVQQVLLK